MSEQWYGVSILDLRRPRTFRRVALKDLKTGWYYRVVLNSYGNFFFDEEFVVRRPYMAYMYQEHVPVTRLRSIRGVEMTVFVPDLGCAPPSTTNAWLVPANSKNRAYLEALKKLGPVAGYLALRGLHSCSYETAWNLEWDWRQNKAFAEKVLDDLLSEDA